MLEENPFEDTKIAQEWVNWVETKDYKGTRYTEIYPCLTKWIQEAQPKTIVDVGSGQGIASEYLGVKDIQYIGVEPSVPLLERAEELYKEKNKRFIVGNAYNLPLPDESIDAVFSIGVWFHLKNINTASSELARTLKHGGRFLIITANPATYYIWKTFFIEAEERGEMITGKISIRGHALSRNDFYFHPLEKITRALEESGLVIDEIDNLGYKKEYNDEGIHICLKGHKI